ncbi:site-2 protease family protein [Ornithinimicrobium murale]|uniref:site-2 protease family protein n=1 Tax=Ornithinimicrobium murale TaxID=1050153 RepID=UPI000E0D493C|nr:site-2 protease family protein [Ornithinimicrobium murale]
MTMGDFLGILSVTLLVFAAGAVHVVVHEVAHALAARMTGIGVPEVTMGAGKAWLRFRLFGTVVKVGGFNGGVTQLEPRSEAGLRCRLAAVTAAGPLSNLALALVSWLLLAGASAGSLAELVRWALVVLGVLITVVNLLPLTLQGGAVRSDGALLLSLARGGRRSARQALAAGRLSVAMRRHAAGELPGESGNRPGDEGPIDRSDPVILGVEGTRRIFTGELDQAVALLREAAPLPQDDHTRAMTLNNLAWALLLSRPDGWLLEADQTSAEALRLQPWEKTFDSTRGCVLVELGELVEGRDLLRQCDLDEAASRDRAFVLDHLLRAEARMGNLYGARAALLQLIADGADEHIVITSRALLRPMEVEHALSSLLGPDGRFVWPEHREGDEISWHVAEMRSALTAFVRESDGDPRGDQVRVALGGLNPAGPATS